MADMSFSNYPQLQPNSLMQNMQGAVSVANGMQQNQLMQTQNQQSHQDLVKGQVNTLMDAFSSLATNPNVGYQDFQRVGSTLLKQGTIDPNTYQMEMDNLPQQADPQTYRNIANGYLARVMDAGQRYGMEFGTPPGTRNMLNTYTNASGQPTTGTNEQIITKLTGQDPFATSGAPVNQMTGTPLTPPAAGNAGQIHTIGDTPPQATPAPQPMPDPTQGVASAAPAPAPSATGPVAPAETGPFDPTKYYPNGAPQQTSGMIAAPSQPQLDAMKASSAQYQQDKQMAGDYQKLIMPSGQLTQLFKKTWTGPGADALNNLGQVAATFGIPWTKDQSANISEIKKWAAVLAGSMPGAAGSDLRTINAQDATPGVEMDGAAALKISQSIFSLAKMKYAVTQSAMDDPNVNNNNYTDYTAQMSKKMDPRAFRFDIMGPGEKAQISKEITAGGDAGKGAAQRWNTSFDLAKKYNLLDAPGGAANGQQ